MSIVHYKGVETVIEGSIEQFYERLDSFAKSVDIMRANEKKEKYLASISYGHIFQPYNRRCKCGLEEGTYVWTKNRHEIPICPLAAVKEYRYHTGKEPPEDKLKELQKHLEWFINKYQN